MSGAGVDLDLRPLSPTIGAEIRGIDCAALTDEPTVAAIRQVWLERRSSSSPISGLTTMPRSLSPGALVSSPSTTRWSPCVVARAEVHTIDAAKDRTDFWHTDITFMQRPAMASLLALDGLCCVRRRTMWSDTRAAYESLAEPLRRLCDELVAFHFEPFMRRWWPRATGTYGRARSSRSLLPHVHPVVQCTPRPAGRTSSSIRSSLVRLVDWPEAQSDALLRLLYDHMTDPRFVVRYHWAPWDVAFRTTGHDALRIFDYAGDGGPCTGSRSAVTGREVPPQCRERSTAQGARRGGTFRG